METFFLFDFPVCLGFVLIVPCGMETTFLIVNFLMYVVLIVPCGMETPIHARRTHNGAVLIVPCGMETHVQGY